MTPEELRTQIDRLVDDQRQTCLWYLRADYYPRTPAEQLAVLEAIQKRCTLDVFRRAGELKQWVSPSSNVTSVGS